MFKKSILVITILQLIYSNDIFFKDIMIFGGRFSSISLDASNLIIYDLKGNFFTNFFSNSRINGAINAIQIYQQFIYVAGKFDQINGQPGYNNGKSFK